MSPEEYIAKVHKFTAQSHAIFSLVETSQQSRSVLLSQSYQRLKSFSVRQDDTIRQALRCTENGLYRAAHVMAWSAAIDYLESFAAHDGFMAINAAMSKWAIKDLEDLKDRFGEHAIIEAMKAAKLISKTEMKAFHGLLSRRNECAHPTSYFPEINQTLGYITEILNRLETIENRRFP